MASKNAGVTSPTEALRRIFGDDLLSALTDTRIVGDEVEFHEGSKIILPQGMTYERAYSILERLQQEAETPTEFGKRFMYRPNDGAYATFQVIKKLYGMALGKPEMSFFGLQPAGTRTIAISPTETMQVPWGNLEIPVFPGLTITLCDQHHDRDYGAIFEIHATGPKKYGPQLERLFDAISEFLKTNSIYRGRAIGGNASPELLDQ
jgi:transitional endoplasmic reticulum ATPase